MRLRADGTLDPDFANAAIAMLPQQYAAGADLAARLFIDHDHLLVAGSCGYGTDGNTLTGRFCAVRLSAGGQIDASYGNGGWAHLDFAPVVRARATAPQDDGKLLLAGTTTTAGSADFCVARLAAGGSLDAGFGNGNGYVVVGFDRPTPSGQGIDNVSTIALQSGRIVVVGDTDGVPYIRALAAVRSDNDLIFSSKFD